MHFVPGARIAERYTLRAVLGEGAHGEVWAARDEVAGDEVAVKMLLGAVQPARVRREVAVLRTLRIPGAVQLQDEGVHEGRPYLVMQLVDGAPFPARDIPARWAELAEMTLGLLETMARIHAAGVVHRDLKPANVLVDAAGRATVLDFGLSRLRSPTMPLVTQNAEILGTPRYLAPEQVSGEAITPRTDLYAVGVMLYEALSGRAPHDDDLLGDLLRAKLTRRPTPLAELAPEVPFAVAEVVDDLLEIQEHARPRSAIEVASRLRGERPPELAPFPLLGRRDGIDAVIAAARAGRAIDVVGPAGTGRSRTLAEARKALVAEGRTVLATSPARRPLAALQGVIGSLDDLANATLAEAQAAAETRLAERLAAGAVLIVDDADDVDAVSAAVIAKGRELGAVVRAFRAGSSAGDVVELRALTREELEGLFAGPDRILHLREDAARALARRTGGVAGYIVEEIGAWIRAGLARWDGGVLVVERDAIEYLEAGIRGEAALARVETAGSALPQPLEELLGWIAAAAAPLRPETLAKAAGQPPWRVQADLDDLAKRGAVTLDLGGAVTARWMPSTERWSPDRWNRVHAALARALDSGEAGRFVHLVAAGEATDAREVAREAKDLAEKLARDGRIGRAVVILVEALRVARHELLDGRELVPLLSLWTEVALADVTASALDRLLYELARLPDAPREVRRLEALARAGLAVQSWTERALAVVDDVAPFSDPALERRRQGVRVNAARRASLAAHRAVMDDVLAWAKGTGLPEDAAAAAGWLGRLRYREGRFDEAAALHDRSTDPNSGGEWLGERIAGRLNAAAALLEIGRLDEARARATDARDRARGCRHVFFEARAEWILRCVAHRGGDAPAPDLELASAAAALRFPEFEAQVYLIEAAIALRAGQPAVARELTQRARAFGQTRAEPFTALLVDAVYAASGGELSAPESDALIDRARRCPADGIALQTLALVARTGRGGIGRDELERRAASIPKGLWGLRREVLSVDEALERD